MGCIASALFVCVGLLYERYKTRVINYYGGLGFGYAFIRSIFFSICSSVISRFLVQELL